MPEFGDVDFPVTTAFELPGMRIEKNLGVAFGLVVRSVGFAKGFTGAVRSLRQGEVSEYTQVLEDARRHAIDRMIENAQLLDANGIVGMRFDSAEMGQGLAEIVAYGSAVVVTPSST
ncbi:MAG: YbjQ family protein [Streptosporangiales bacterium]